MFNLPLMSVVNKIVEHELVGKGRDKEALHIHLDLRMSYYGIHEVFNTSRGLHLLYWVPLRFSYISVFSAVTSSPFTKAKEIETLSKVKELEATGWKHEITHDSCWREIRTVTDLYFEMAKEIMTAMGDEAKLLAPVDMSEHNDFALFGSLFDWIPVEISKDPTDPHNYRKIIVLK